jgi:D-3-phosphoglycerate dehydrogenase
MACSMRDDAITARVIDAALPRLTLHRQVRHRARLDRRRRTPRRCALPVLFTPGVNHTTVAEHTIGLMIALTKHFWPHLRATKAGGWKRLTGSELAGKRLALLGLGRIGRRSHRRAGPRVRHAPDARTTCTGMRSFADPRGRAGDQPRGRAGRRPRHVTAHEPRHATIAASSTPRAWRRMRARGAGHQHRTRGAWSTRRPSWRRAAAARSAATPPTCSSSEPPPGITRSTGIDNILVTPHVGSRTHESVERQGQRAARNIVNFLRGDDDYIQAN